jgi:D-glycero-D-manno-heptose 1,7-bisphosphate phosphatase
MKRAIFIDKDGTLIKNVAYNADPEKIVLESFAGEALRLLVQEGFKLIVVSNQAGIAKGYFHEYEMKGVIDKVNNLLEDCGVKLSGFFYCPHHPEGVVAPYAVTCNCRKPMPGMLTHAASMLNINLNESWMIGDILHDVEAGNRAGCRSLLINNGNETEWEKGAYRAPAYMAHHLMDAANYIVNHLKN